LIYSLAILRAKQRVITVNRYIARNTCYMFTSWTSFFLSLYLFLSLSFNLSGFLSLFLSLFVYRLFFSFLCIYLRLSFSHSLFSPLYFFLFIFSPLLSLSFSFSCFSTYLSNKQRRMEEGIDGRCQRMLRRSLSKTMASRVVTTKPQTTHDGFVGRLCLSHPFSFSLSLSCSLTLPLSCFFYYPPSRSSISHSLDLSLSLSCSSCLHNKGGIDGGCQLVLREQAMANKGPNEILQTHTLSLFLSHTLTHTHTYAHARTRTLVLLSRSLTLRLSRTQTYSLTLSLSHTQTYTRIQDGGCSFFRCNSARLFRCNSVRSKRLLLWIIHTYVKQAYMYTKTSPTRIRKRSLHTHACIRKRALYTHKSQDCKV